MAEEGWNGDGCEAPQGPVLCANNCGFFGSKTTMNLCSKCYRDIVLQQQQQQQIQLAIQEIRPAPQDPQVKPPGPSELHTSSPPDHNPLPQPQESQAEPPKSSPNRCLACNKRLTLASAFKCRCGDSFCSAHRYSDEHNCSFDYKAAGREAISKANPVVKAPKLDKI